MLVSEARRSKILSGKCIKMYLLAGTQMRDRTGVHGRESRRVRVLRRLLLGRVHLGRHGKTESLSFNSEWKDNS